MLNSDPVRVLSGWCPNKQGLGTRFWCGQCYANVRCRENNRGHLHYRVPRKKKLNWEDSAMKQMIGTGGSSQLGVKIADAAMVKRFPKLLEYLETDVYEDGKPRTRSTLTVFVQDGGVKVCLNDKDSNMSLFRTGSGLQQALDALEKDLASGEQLDWKGWNLKKRGK